MWLAALAAAAGGGCGGDEGGAAGAGGDGAGALGGECDTCQRTADCAPPLRCRGRVCVPADGAGDCGAAAGGGGGGGVGGSPTCDALCRDAEGCGAVGPGGAIGADVATCAAQCAALSDAGVACLRARVDERDCGPGALDPCLGAAADEGHDDSLEAFCEGLCATAASPECGALAPGGFFGDDPAECVAECLSQGGVDQDLVTCLGGLVADGRCAEDELATCATRGDGSPDCEPDDEGCDPAPACGPDGQGDACACTDHCEKAEACGLLGALPPAIAQGLTECVTLCISLLPGDPEGLACAEANFDAGRCELEAYMACFGPGQGIAVDCEAFCDQAGDCELVGPGAPFADDYDTCAASCARMKDEALEDLRCIASQVEQPACTREAVATCMGDGEGPGGEDPGGGQGGAGDLGCEPFCDGAVDCGLVGPESDFAADYGACIQRCSGMAEGAPAMLACLAERVEAGACSIGDLEACQGGGEGGFGDGGGGDGGFGDGGRGDGGRGDGGFGDGGGGDGGRGDGGRGDGGGGGGGGAPSAACAQMCNAAADCGLVGGPGGFAPDATSCQRQCAIWSEARVACAQGVADGSCSLEDLFACQ